MNDMQVAELKLILERIAIALEGQHQVLAQMLPEIIAIKMATQTR